MSRHRIAPSVFAPCLAPLKRVAVMLPAIVAGSCASNSSHSAYPDAAPEVSPAPPAAVVESPPPPEPSLEPFEQTVEGTTITFEMVPVASGAVSVGEGDATQRVEVEPFWIARTETIWQLYDVFVFELDDPDEATSADAITRPSRPYVSPDRGYGHDGYAAISLSFKGATQFCVWLSAKTGRTYRLPTEAEWKLVCQRSGVTPSNATAHAWFQANADETPHPVATREAGDLGLFDLWGNVREWCIGYDGEPVALGGSFRDDLDHIGCGARAVPTPEWQATDPQFPKSSWWLSDADFVGFRIVCEPDTEDEENGS